MKYLRSVKVLIAFALMVFAIILVLLGEIQTSGYLFIASLIILFAHLFFGEVIAAYKQLGMRNFEKAERLLDSTFSEDLLFKMHRAYFYLSKSILSSKRGAFEESEYFLQKSTQTGGLRDRDKVMAWVNLSYLFLSRGDKQKAIDYFEKTKSIAVNDLRVKSELEKLEGLIHSRP